MRVASRWRQRASLVLRGVLLVLLAAAVAIGFFTRHTADPKALKQLPTDFKDFTWQINSWAGNQEDLCSWKEYRLPTSVYPIHYDLHLALKESGSAGSLNNGQQQWWVVGHEDIEVEVLAATPCIVLHSDNTILLHSATIDG